MEADVVILGSGGAAMTAAIAAYDFGAKDVAILEKSGMVGGPKTNADAQVLDWHGNPIPGLYAAGDAMAAVPGEAYGGAGGTLGPGMTFDYIAGRHLGRHIPNV
jgi:succinate dehydrogenase/fumarate reductase flavoprotein subunit